MDNHSMRSKSKGHGMERTRAEVKYEANDHIASQVSTRVRIKR